MRNSTSDSALLAVGWLVAILAVLVLGFDVGSVIAGILSEFSAGLTDALRYAAGR